MARLEMNSGGINYIDLANQLAGMDIPEEVLTQSGIIDLGKAARMLAEGTTDAKGAAHIQGGLNTLDQLVNPKEASG